MLPLLRGGDAKDWRDCVFSELDYAFYKARLTLGDGPNDSRIYMLRSDRWKYIAFKGYRPQLFDLQEDPDELNDLGASPAHDDIRRDMQARLFDRLTSRRNRIALPTSVVEALTAKEHEKGILIGDW